MKQDIRIFKGLYKEQKQIVKDVFSSKYNFITIKAGRQSGKSFTLDRLAISLSLNKRKQEVLWCTPSHGQSSDALERIQLILNNKLPHKVIKSPSDRHILFDNGSKIRFASADRYDNLRGKHPDYLILDEMAFFKQGAWELALKPYFIANKKLICISASTPSGKNTFYDLWNSGELLENYKNHNLHYTMNPNVNLEFIEQERLKSSPQVFNQEYEGIFVFGNSQVFGSFEKNQIISEYNNEYDMKCYFGLDISGDGEDKTVLTIINDIGHVVKVYEVESTNHIHQCSELESILSQYKDISGYGEKNGLGNSLIDLLLDKGINIYKWITTNDTKQKLVAELILNLNTNKLYLPTSTLCPKLDNEMSIYMVGRTNGGRLNYTHPKGLHDDYVDSLMMANYARNTLGSNSVSLSPQLLQTLNHHNSGNGYWV